MSKQEIKTKFIENYMFASLKQNFKKFLSKAMSLKKSSTTESTKIGMVTIGYKNEFLGKNNT